MKYLVILLAALLVNATTRAQTDSSLVLKLDTLTQLKLTADSLRKTSQKFINENSKYARQIDSLKKNMARTAATAARYDKVLDSLTEKVETSEKKLNDITRQIEEENKKYAGVAEAFKKEIAALDSTKEKLSKDNKKLDSANKDLDSTNKNIESNIEKRKAMIAKQMDSLEVVATIKLNRDRVRIWIDTKKENELKTEKIVDLTGLATAGDVEDYGKRRVLQVAKVEEITISVREGFIMEIIVKTNHGIYRNSKSIISLLHLGETGKTYQLQYEHQDYKKWFDWSYIFLDDVIKYTPIRSYGDIAYGNFDITLTPTDDGREYLIRESTSINTYFSIAAFTDIKGISGEPNGLAQFTADAKFITNTKNLRNSAIVWFNYVSFHGGLAKFDNDFKGTALMNDDSVSRKDLLQRSTYVVGVKANLVRAFASPRPTHLFHDLQINAGYNFMGTKVYDTVFKDQARTIIDTNYRTVTQNQFYIEPIAVLSRHRNFSMSMRLPFYLINLKKSSAIRNSSAEYWVAPGVTLMYYGKKDAGSKIFFRYNHYINLKDNKQAFSQMQLGYSVNLTEVWGKQQ
jgi:hypothetical protein